MRGDILVIEPHHEAAAAAIASQIAKRFGSSSQRFALGIAGESGSGKSEIAQALCQELEKRGILSLVLQQDDYFVLPPRSNDRRRREDIRWVGPEEVDLQRLGQDVQSFLEGVAEIEKPLVIYAEDRIEQEALSADGCQAIIVEGTYVSLVPSLTVRIFIHRDYTQTLDARRRRNRESLDPFIEQVLEIEHHIIREHKKFADFLVESDYSIREVASES